MDDNPKVIRKWKIQTVESKEEQSEWMIICCDVCSYPQQNNFFPIEQFIDR